MADVLAMVHFVKRRDQRGDCQGTKGEGRTRQGAETRIRQARCEMQEAVVGSGSKRAAENKPEERILQEEANDLTAGRVRLADLDDDYGYGGKRGRKGKKKKPQYHFESISEEEEEETQVEGEGLELTATGDVEQVDGEAVVKEAGVDGETTVGEEEATSEKPSASDDEQQVDEEADEVLEEEFYSYPE
jgi:hypothetical protein